MANCEKLPICPFYQGKMDINSALGKLYRQTYCEGDKTKCARYTVATKLGPQYVTNNLYPNMMDVATKMLKEHK